MFERTFSCKDIVTEKIEERQQTEEEKYVLNNTVSENTRYEV